MVLDNTISTQWENAGLQVDASFATDGILVREDADTLRTSGITIDNLDNLDGATGLGLVNVLGSKVKLFLDATSTEDFNISLPSDTPAVGQFLSVSNFDGLDNTISTQWENAGLQVDASFATDGILVREDADTLRTSGITIDNLDNLAGATGLGLVNVLGSKVKLLLDATSTEDFNINLPSDTPSVGQFLSVSNFDGLDNTISTQWENAGLQVDASFATDGILVRQDADTLRTSGITIDNLDNLAGATGLGLVNVLGSKVKLFLDATSTEDFNISLPSDTPSVGQFLSVSNFDGLDNTISTQWENAGLQVDASFATDGILVRQDADTLRTSGITIDNLDNLDGATGLGLVNVLGSKVKLLLDATSTEDFNINLPSDTPSVGQFLSVSSFDGLDNTIFTQWSTVSHNSPQLIVVTLTPSGDQYSSISAAIASITDAGINKPYLVQVRPGVYVDSNIMIPSFVAVQGVSMEACVVSGGSSSTVFSMSSNSCLSFLTIQTTQGLGSGLRAVEVIDSSIVNIASVYIAACATGIYCEAVTGDSIVRMYNVIISGVIDIAVHIYNNSAFELTAVVTNAAVRNSNVGVPVGLQVEGQNSDVHVQGSNFAGPGSGTGVFVAGGAHVGVFSTSFARYSVGIRVPIQSGAPHLVVSGVEFEDVALQLDIQEEDCEGHITGFVPITDVNIHNAADFFCRWN